MSPHEIVVLLVLCWILAIISTAI